MRFIQENFEETDEIRFMVAKRRYPDLSPGKKNDAVSELRGKIDWTTGR
jgi:hypothetical protein